MISGSAATVRLSNVVLPGASDRADLPGIDFCAHSTEVIVLVGPDATLPRQFLRGMAAVEQPRQGDVEVLGVASGALDRAGYKALRQRIGYVVGAGSLLPIYNGLTNVMLPALYHYTGMSFRAVSELARRLLTELECDFDLQLLPHQMNSFQQRKIQLARALILEPDILFLEEPFHDLVVDERRLFAAKLMKIRARLASKSIIMSTDHLDFARRHADRIVYVSPQRVEEFPNWEAFSTADDEDIRRFLGREYAPGRTDRQTGEQGATTE